ncbi:MAG TPA: ABC transporter substrate-binding protein [Pirellulales bacterium]|jgi:peptide/nickel transport system substrate-binding protein|nr:ABC transporter substrate-binding protein [Pirellulales bacterium]
MTERSWLAALLTVAGCVFICGDFSPLAYSATTGDSSAAAAKPDAASNPPATLAELDKSVEWVDKPVYDSLKLLADDLVQHPPLVSAAEALKLKNDSPQNNEKIISALGRLPAGGEKPDDHARIMRYLIGDINSANPVMEDTIYEATVLAQSKFGLMIYNWKMQPNYCDADTTVRWQQSKDHLIDKVTMRRDCFWSDGKPITAHDIAFSFHAIMNEKIPVPAMRTDTSKLRDVVAYDDYTVVYFHKQALATGDGYLNFGIIPEHIFKLLYDKLNRGMTFDELLQTPEYQQTELHPVSGNAYVMTNRIRNQEIVFKRRDDWYLQNGRQVRQKPFFEEIRFAIKEDPNTALLDLKRGTLDDYEIQQAQWANQTNDAEFYRKNTKAYGSEWTYFFFGWNNDSDSAPFFRDRRVREAMSYAFDYRELIDKTLYGLCQQCTGITNPEAWYAPKTPLKPYVQDLDKAEKLLDEAGWVDSDGDGIRDKMVNGQRVKFEFSMTVKNDPERIKICEIMQFNLQQLGITCNIKPMEGTRLFEKLLKREFEAEFSGWGTGTDPAEDENVWASTEIPDEGRNYLAYRNLEVDKLFQQGIEEFEPAKRAEIYAKIDELIYHDQPCTFLYWRSAFYGFNKQLRGYKFSPRGPYDYSPGFSSIWMTAQ